MHAGHGDVKAETWIGAGWETPSEAMDEEESDTQPSSVKKESNGWQLASPAVDLLITADRVNLQTYSHPSL
jgi:hypothetical protein